jgi:hypothetical protein
VFFKRVNEIYPKDLQDILHTEKYFSVVLVFVDKQSIGASYKKPIPFPQQRYFIREQSIEMILEVSRGIEWCRIAKPVIGHQLETGQVLRRDGLLVAGVVLIIRQGYLFRSHKTSHCQAIIQPAAQFQIKVVADRRPPFGEINIASR